ncbi:MAG TPA: hypothetical protein VGJ95_22195 [Pseudonocardiaceae bacterium]
MKAAVRIAIVVAALVCVATVAWVFKGPAASNTVIGNANVVGGVAAVMALLLAVAVLWPSAGPRRATAAPVATGPAQAASDYLARETLRYWRVQAKDRRITTPSPAAVRWGWASEAVAVPAWELQHGARVLTAGVVTGLREQLYDRLESDRVRVVVLGGPGAGKTAAMLLLLIDVLEHRPEGSQDPVPVWLTLGGWNPSTSSLQDWAAVTLTRDYPGLAAPEHGGSGAAAQLLRTRRVALFLDGLDEMPPAVQGKALQVIDRDAAGLRIVLTSRPQEYADAIAAGRLYGATVIDLQPVGVDQAEAFLLAEQLGNRRDAWRRVTAHVRSHPDSVAARTLTTPLALSLGRDTYATGDPANLLDTGAYPTPDTLLQHLLARSLTLAYPDSAQREHATRWLSWIAQHMGTNRDLRWWDIPGWTPRWQRRLLVGLVVGVAFGFVFGLAGNGLVVGLLGGLVFGLVGGLVGRRVGEPKILTVRWPDRHELRHHVLGLADGLGSGLVLGLGVGLVGGVVVGLVLGLAFGLAVVLTYVWSRPFATQQAVSPLEVYRADCRRDLVFGLVGVLVTGVTAGVVGGVVVGAVVGLVVGPVVGLVVAEGPAFQLAVVEMIWRLRVHGVRFLPLLRTALDKQVLRQAGAVYQFRHAALQDFIASGEFAPPPSGVIIGVQDTHSGHDMSPP